MGLAHPVLLISASHVAALAPEMMPPGFSPLNRSSQRSKVQLANKCGTLGALVRGRANGPLVNLQFGIHVVATLQSWMSKLALTLLLQSHTLVVQEQRSHLLRTCLGEFNMSKQCPHLSLKMLWFMDLVLSLYVPSVLELLVKI